MDGLDSLDVKLGELPEAERVTCHIKADPRGDRRIVPPFDVRRDTSLDGQVIEHLEGVGEASGPFEIRLRHAGRYIAQATVHLALRQVAPRVARGGAAGGPPGARGGAAGGGAVGVEGDAVADLAGQLHRRALERVVSRLDEPEEPEEPEEEDEEDEEDEEEPQGRTFLGGLLSDEDVKTGALGLLGALTDLVRSKVPDASKAAPAGPPKASPAPATTAAPDPARRVVSLRSRSGGA